MKIRYRQDNSSYHENIGYWYLDTFKLVEGTNEIMELNQHPKEETNNNFDSNRFILTRQNAAAKEGGEAPEYSGNQKQKEKPVPDTPGPVSQQNNE